jgi:DNA-binding MarR family transcriptional regulator
MDLKIKRSFGFYFSFITRQAHRYFEQKFQPFGLHRGSIFILRKLYNQDGIRQNELCNYLHLDKANITRTVAKLIELDYVRKEQDITDSRANRIYLTTKGKDFRPEFDMIFQSWNDVLTTGMIDIEKDELKKDLIKMSENAWNYFKEFGKNCAEK